MNPRHSAWEADAPRRHPAHPQGATSPTVHPLPRPLPRPASSRRTSVHDRPSERAPRTASVPRTAATRGGRSATRAPGRARAPCSPSRPGGCHATHSSRREPGTNPIRVERTTAARPPAASGARRGPHGRRPRRARPAPAARCRNEPLVEIAAEPPQAPGRRRVRVRGAQQSRESPPCRSSQLLRVPCEVRSRSPAAAYAVNSWKKLTLPLGYTSKPGIGSGTG